MVGGFRINIKFAFELQTGKELLNFKKSCCFNNKLFSASYSQPIYLVETLNVCFVLKMQAGRWLII
jgi:hypothetical protein